MNRSGNNQGVAVLAAVAAGVVCLLLGVTMWLVPWATETAAGILMLLGVILICVTALIYGRGASKKAADRRGFAKNDGRLKAAREKAMALVGKVAVALLLLLTVILLIGGSLGSTAFMTVILGFLVLFLVVVAATIYYVNKI